jgi:hypothetical protein
MGTCKLDHTYKGYDYPRCETGATLQDRFFKPTKGYNYHRSKYVCRCGHCPNYIKESQTENYDPHGNNRRGKHFLEIMEAEA